MKTGLSFVKATVLGGVFFLVPLGMVVLLLSKIVPVLATIEKKLGGAFPTETTFGLVVLNVCALLVIVLLCFLAGLAAQSKKGQKLIELLEDSVLGALPGYTFMKGFTTDMRQSDEAVEGFTPVIARFDDYSQVAFEIERIDSTGKVVVYLPGAPNPWSGSLAYVDPDRIEPLDASVPQVVRHIKMLGRGSDEMRDEVLEG